MSKPPVILIHGVGLNPSMWDEVATDLGADRKVVRYPMLGHTGAACPPGPYSLSMFIDQLRSVVAESLGQQTGAYDLVGFSMGALVAQGHGASRPSGLRRLALLHPVFDRTDDERSAIAARVAEVRSGGFAPTIPAALDRWFTPQFAATNPLVIDRVRDILSANNEVSYADAYEVFATADAALIDAAALIEAPTLVVTGADDQRSTPTMTLRLAARIRNAEAVVLPNLRHMAPVENPTLVASELRRFLDRRDPDRRDLG